MTFTQNKNSTRTVRTGKNTTYPFILFEKTHKKRSLGSKFDNKPQIADSGTKHTVTTDKNKDIHRKLISNPIPFQSSVTPTKRINTRTVTIPDKPSFSETDERTRCGYQRRESPRPQKTENSAYWLMRTEQSRNEREQFTSPDKLTGKPENLDISMVSEDEDFQCYNTAEGKLVHKNSEGRIVTAT